MDDLPEAPWSLRGECVITVARGQRSTVLPGGLRPLPGPLLIFAERWTDSPVGPYVSLGIAEPARLGLRPGMCFSTVVVSTADSRAAGRVNWGFPRELGTLRWSADGDDRELVWEERELTLTATASRTPLPVLLPIRAVQRRADGPVINAGRLWGKGHLASVAVEVPRDDPLASLGGTHRGVTVAAARLILRPARHPVGVLSTLQAPLRAPEPGLSSQAVR